MTARATPDDYLAQRQQLLPVGAAWPRDPEATLTKVQAAKADEDTRAHNRALDLLEEMDPRTTLELLPDWERVCGLPDQCVGAEGQTLQERRAAVHAKLTSLGGQSRAYFIALAKTLGYDCTITEFRPFTAGSSAGDPCCDQSWRHAWRLNAPEVTIRPFTAGASTAGEPLRAWGNKMLECAITARKPAHTHCQFAYGG